MSDMILLGFFVIIPALYALLVIKNAVLAIRDYRADRRALLETDSGEPYPPETSAP